MASLPHDAGMSDRSAVLSDCGLYRWRLDREIAPAGLTAAVFGINPSTADALLDDATVRKWRGFGQRLSWGRVLVGNAFAWRATDVRELARAADPFGQDYDLHLEAIIGQADLLVPCWGDRGKIPKALRPQLDALMGRFTSSGKPVMCWGLTAGGDPRHPLMLGYHTPLRDFSVLA